MDGGKQRSLVLFDFDGVIADSFETAFSVERRMCPHITEEEYRAGFNGNINDWQKEQVRHSAACRHDLDWFAEYVPVMKKSVSVFPGMADVIRELSSQYLLVIVSSTISSPIRDFMEKYALAGYFADIMGNDVHKSKVEKIKMAMSVHSIGPDQSVFITDTVGDMREATQIGVGTIAVSWGFQRREVLAQGSPFRIVDTPADLPGAVESYFQKGR